MVSGNTLALPALIPASIQGGRPMTERGHAASAFPTPIRMSGAGGRSQLRNLGEAKRFVENELPTELRKQPRWTFAGALVKHALASGKQRDLRVAERQLRQALSNEKWLLANEPEPRPAPPAKTRRPQ
jgi:hypothetical protein